MGQSNGTVTYRKIHGFGPDTLRVRSDGGVSVGFYGTAAGGKSHGYAYNADAPETARWLSFITEEGENYERDG